MGHDFFIFKMGDIPPILNYAMRENEKLIDIFEGDYEFGVVPYDYDNYYYELKKLYYNDFFVIKKEDINSTMGKLIRKMYQMKFDMKEQKEYYESSDYKLSIIKSVYKK